MLLYDGEELVGAKQNRILNVTVLVGAGAKLPIPVSCVEQGRWTARSVDFDAATHISHAHLRRRKAEMLAAQPLARGVAQSEVWSEVGEKQERMAVASPTGANRDTFEAYGDRLREARGRVPARARPVRRRARDRRRPLPRLRVSRPAAFTVLWPKLRAGYLLDALERLDQRPADIERIAGFVDEVADAPRHARPVRRARRGRPPARPRRDRLRPRARRRAAPAVRLHEPDGGQRAFGRIARPSRRR